MVKRRIGLLLPSSNTTMEPEFYAMAPEGLTIHSARMRLEEVTPETLEEMAREARRAASLLATAEVDVLVYGCTSGSLLKGVKWERRLVEELEDETGIEAVSTAGAVVEALKELGVRRVAVATPYIDEINRLEQRFLEECGFEVAAIKGLSLRKNTEIGVVCGDRVVELARGVAGDAEGVFISCTNLPTIGVIERLERELDKPVVTSNQASMWMALKVLGLGPVSGYGVLLQRLKPSGVP